MLYENFTFVALFSMKFRIWSLATTWCSSFDDFICSNRLTLYGFLISASKKIWSAWNCNCKFLTIVMIIYIQKVNTWHAFEQFWNIFYCFGNVGIQCLYKTRQTMTCIPSMQSRSLYTWLLDPMIDLYSFDVQQITYPLCGC